MKRDEVPFALFVLTLTCEVNIRQNLTEIPALTTDNAQFEHVNVSRKVVRELPEANPMEQRIRGSTNRLQTRVMAVLGKPLARTETLQSVQRDREMRSVRFDVELLAEGWVHRKASRSSSVSSHAGRGHSPTSGILDRTEEYDIQGGAGNREVGGQTRTDFSDPRVGRRVSPSTWSGMENLPENKTRGGRYL